MSHIDNVSPEPNTGCWLWVGAVDRHGYARLGRRRVHRIVAGATSRPEYVLHKCDQPSCVNPEHIYLGSQADNMRDMEARGRSRHPRGERHGRAKLRWCDVEEIRSARACGVLVRDLAFRFGVSPAAISLAASGKNWRRK